MVNSVFLIPLQPAVPQTLSVPLDGVTYRLTFLFHNDPITPTWTVDIADSAGNPIIQGIPLVTGANLLAQYQYLGFNGALVVQTASDPDAVPTFENLGSDANVWWISP